MEKIDAVADFGLIGLAVMGQNLILNGADKGFTVAAFNRTVSKVDHFLENEAKGKSIVGAHTVEEFIALLKRPRKIIILVKAGDAVDQFIETLLPLLEKGDIIMDGGNSHYPDTNRRCDELAKRGILFIGMGISGGEEGARNGPSIMPGGHFEAWKSVKPILQTIAAKSDGEPCCDWVGEGGAGHYVKQTHNGIEYGDMQMICEVYHILSASGMKNEEIADVFDRWNVGVLDSFLIEITRDILRYKDAQGINVVDIIEDVAGQKGTGKWTAINALDLGMPLTLIGEAVFARCLSSLRDERVKASKFVKKTGTVPFRGDNNELIRDLEQALYASKIISYTQGFMLMRDAAKIYNWDLNFAGIALMWRGGCIIRSIFLKEITSAFQREGKLENLLFDNFFKNAIEKAQPSWRKIIGQATMMGIPIPALSSALSFFDGYTSERLPANLLQAQRDYFGAHTFVVLPQYTNENYKKDDFVHVNWTGHGGNISASSYQV